MLLRFILTITMTLQLFSPGTSEACVGRILQIGALDTPDGRVMAVALALMINERTGTSVDTKYFANSQALYDAVSKREVGIFLENTSRAMQRLGQHEPADYDEAYKQAKQLYRTELNLIWLDPFSFDNAEGEKPSRTATLISKDVLEDFPGLPRLLNKLARRVNNKEYAALVENVKSGEDPRQTALHFLNIKKLI
jgi:glycine betaine/choline ABC-type transport system substrate-binding protein